MGCRLQNTCWAVVFFLFFLFLGQHRQKKTILQAGASKSAAHTVSVLAEVLF
jgi:hypothetical protein